MLNSSAAGKRQVDDFNTVALGDVAEVAEDPVRPNSAWSDPGVRNTAGGVEPELEPRQAAPDAAPTPTPAPSVDDRIVDADVTSAAAANATSPGLLAQSPQPRSPSPLAQPPPAAESPTTLPQAERELLTRIQPANTPTTPCTDFSRRQGVSRPSQQTATTVLRRQIYDEAVSLVAARCVTNPLSSSDWQRHRQGSDGAADPPPGFGGPRVFYVRQQRPRPMTPLKAWAGYHGNVYFTPLSIRRSEFAHPDSLLSLPSLPACSGRLQRVLEPTRLNAEHLMLMRTKSEAAALKCRAPPRRAALIGPQQPPLVQLDRAYLASRAASRQQGQDGGSTAGGSMTVSRDVHLYRSAHATGTLQFQPQDQLPHQESEQQSSDETQQSAGRVYRGSVSRKLHDLRLAMSTESALQSPTSSNHRHQQQQQPPPPQQQQQQRLAASFAAGGGVIGRHNNSVASFDHDIDALYDRMPSLMAKVPRSQAFKQQQQPGFGNHAGIRVKAQR